MESRSMSHGKRRNSLVGSGNAAPSALPTSNPYASLEALDDSGDQNPTEGVAYT